MSYFTDTTIDISITDTVIQKDKLQSTLVLTRDNIELIRRPIDLLDTDAITSIADDIASITMLNKADVDQRLAELIQPLRTNGIRERSLSEQNEVLDQEGNRQPEKNRPRYEAVLATMDENGISREPYMRDSLKNTILANFVLLLDEDIDFQDDIEATRVFGGKLSISKRTVPFQISAADYADNGKLKAELFKAGGLELVIHCSMDELRKAISTIGKQNGKVRNRTLTTNFGWNKDATAYLTPSVMITKEGVAAVGEEAGIRVDLEKESPACFLDMQMLDPSELTRIKTHIVEDLLKLNDRLVTYTLLGAVGTAILYPFTLGAGRFALWFRGSSGVGKSFIAKLFCNFFGNFPIESAPFSTWSSTANFIQRAGNFFKDALYLVDDYKPETIRYPGSIITVLQTYADNTARGRLRSDATANVTRPIRGQLVSTGEDVPEHHSSALARSVIVKVPQGKKNVIAGLRCNAERTKYSGVTADFIRWLLANDRLSVFSRRFGELQQRYSENVEGQQNDTRVASNLAQLGAAFELIAEYLSDVWPDWKDAVKSFLEDDLIFIRDDMLGQAKEQQASEIFLSTLGELIRFNYVRVDGYSDQATTERKPSIGTYTRANRPGSFGIFYVNINLALAQINEILRQQGRPLLKATETAIRNQLREDGKLLDEEAKPLLNKTGPSITKRIDGRLVRLVRISARDLIGEDGPFGMLT